MMAIFPTLVIGIIMLLAVLSLGLIVLDTIGSLEDDDE